MSTTLKRWSVFFAFFIITIALFYTIAPQAASAEACPSLTRTLSLGALGNDVLQLQQFLAKDPLIYPEGTASGYYGALTEQAVKKFQCKYSIVCSGAADTTGFGVVGSLTRAKIAAVCTQTTTSGITFSVLPQPGAAPLAVTATITVPPLSATQVEICGTINMGTISWGDGTVDSKPTRLGCSGQYTVTLQHTYSTMGTYYARYTDANGILRGTQTVTVMGGSANDTFTAQPATGPVPLNVVFNGKVNTSYFGGVNIDFGDGNTAAFCNPGSACTNNVSHTYNNTGSYVVRLLGVGENGTSVVSALTVNAEKPGTPTVAITLSEKTTGPGKSFSISWNATYAPSGSKVRLEVWPANATPVLGNNDNGVVAPQTSSSGSFSWTVPDEQGCSADSGLLSCIKKGTYKVVAKVYTGDDCWGYCIAGTGRVVHAVGVSSNFTVSDTASLTDYAVGDRVETTDALNVRDSASLSGTLLGSQEKGARGTVKEGPKTSGGFTWWNVDWDTGVDGWSVKDFLKKIKGVTGILTATPTSGQPPLSVTFSANVTTPYVGGVSLRYGDNTSNTVFCNAGSACSNSITHAYAATGTYAVRLVGIGGGSNETELGTATIAVGTGMVCAVPNKDLGLGDADKDTNSQVSVLQTFLKRDSAIYPEGLITGFYGPATEAAVKRYQKSKSILQTGFLGPVTRAAIKKDCGGGGSTTPYKFGASPTSGTAPVTVTFTAVEVETRNGVIWYAVDFGDGERGNMVVSSGSASSTASSTMSVAHSYTKGGTMNARLLQEEDLCGNFGTYSYGCTRELAVDNVSIKIEGGVDSPTAGGSCKTHRFARGGVSTPSGTGGTSAGEVPDSQKTGANVSGGAASGGGYFPGALPQLAANEFMNYPGSDTVAYAGNPTAAAYLQSQFGAPTTVTYPNATVLQGNPAWWGGQANPGVPPDVGCNLQPRICYIYQCQNGAWMQRSTTQPFGEFMYPNVPQPQDFPNDGRAG